MLPVARSKGGWGGWGEGGEGDPQSNAMNGFCSEMEVFATLTRGSGRGFVQVAYRQ